MIPARAGSKRIKNKNIRELNGKPLISYIIEACIKADCFDEIHVNSESELIGEIATSHDINFYKRPESLSTDESTNDEFVLDFIKVNNLTDCNIIQVLPTSPFITSTEIVNFVERFTTGDVYSSNGSIHNIPFTTLVSVTENKIECLHQDEPINFDRLQPTPPSQELNPILSYACALMAWDASNYISNIDKFNSGYHGGDPENNKTFVGTYTLTGLSCIDIDNESDFQLAEAIMRSGYNTKQFKPKYYNSQTKERIEDDVPSILVKDGVPNNDLHDCNKDVVNINRILKSKKEFKSWSKRVINTDSNSATLIQQLPGEGNRRHYHPNWNEWWYIVDGQWEWEVEGEIKVVNKGDIVLIEKNKRHKITAIGKTPAIRLAVSREDVPHIYEH
jgi:CMP-N,N'-diacetyllegionaminic acid synthase